MSPATTKTLSTKKLSYSFIHGGGDTSGLEQIPHAVSIVYQGWRGVEQFHTRFNYLETS